MYELIAPSLSAVGRTAAPGVSVILAEDTLSSHHPNLNPDLDGLILGIDTNETLAVLRPTLRNQYPADHPVTLIQAPGGQDERLFMLRLTALGSAPQFIQPGVLYVPPLEERSSFEALQNTVARLRAPDGCPWDQEQTHQSLRKHLLEETYEVLEALDQGDLDALREELGDLLLQIIMQAQIATEEHRFSMAEVVAGIEAKLIRRHPHVFGDLKVKDVDEVLSNWEHFKEKEHKAGPLDGIPRALPALAQATELLDRARRTGFDRSQIGDVLDNLEEEMQEFRAAEETAAQARMLGNLLFALANYARWIQVDSEAELQRANHEFRRRFSDMVQRASNDGLRFADLPPSEKDLLWEATKNPEI